MKKYSFSMVKEREHELLVPFEYLSKEEMRAEPYNMDECPGSL